MRRLFISWGQEFQSLVEGGIAAVGKVYSGENGDLDVRRHTRPIESLSILGQINLVGQSEAPSVRQLAPQNVGEHSLGIRPHADDMRLAVENGHGKCFRCADAVRAGKQHNRTAEARPLADVNHDGLRRSAMVWIMNVVSGDLGIGEVVLRGEARGDGDTEDVGTATVNPRVDHEARPFGRILENRVQRVLQRLQLFRELLILGIATERVNAQVAHRGIQHPELQLLVAEVTQPAAHIMLLDNLSNSRRVFLLHGVRGRAVSVKSLLDRFRADTGVRVVQRLDHLTQDAKQFLRLRCRRHLRPKLLVHGQPVHLAQRKKWIVLRKRCPENLIIRHRRIRQGAPADLRLRIGAPQQNARNAAVFVQPARVRRVPRRDADHSTFVYKHNFSVRARPTLARRLARRYTTHLSNLKPVQLIPLKLDQLSVAVREPESVEGLRGGLSLRARGGGNDNEYGADKEKGEHRARPLQHALQIQADLPLDANPSITPTLLRPAYTKIEI